MRDLEVDILDGFCNDLLQLIVLPTQACNFRCVCCYEDHAHGRMAACDTGFVVVGAPE